MTNDANGVNVPHARHLRWRSPPSRSRAVFHPSSSLHYLILWAFSCHSYPLISSLIHIPLLCSFHLPSRQVLRARSRGFETTPIFSSLPETFIHYKTIPFTPLWYGGPSPLTRTLHGALRPPRALSLLCKTAPMTPLRCHP